MPYCIYNFILTILMQLSQSHRGWQDADFALVATLEISLLAALGGWFQCRRNFTIPRSPSVPAFNNFLTNRSTLDWCIDKRGGAGCCCLKWGCNDNDLVLPKLLILLSLVLYSWELDTWCSLVGALSANVAWWLRVSDFRCLYAWGLITGRRISRTCWMDS